MTVRVAQTFSILMVCIMCMCHGETSILNLLMDLGLGQVRQSSIYLSFL